jgi:hypothetical protein
MQADFSVIFNRSGRGRILSYSSSERMRLVTVDSRLYRCASSRSWLPSGSVYSGLLVKTMVHVYQNLPYEFNALL